MAKEKVVLAYSGGLDTSVAIKWLQEKYNYDCIALSVDVGEGKDLDAVREKALRLGAMKSYVIDAKALFASEFILPALKANAMYEGKYPLSSSLSRPLISQLLVQVAEEEGAVAVAHGCTGKGNDQVRFEVSINALNPNLKIVAPVREWKMNRDEELAYAELHGIPVAVKKENPFSIDQNMWGRANEAGVLEDPWVEPPEEAYDLTASISHAPDEPEEVELRFVKGVPTALNGQEVPLHELILSLNKLAGRHGVGRIDHIENRLVGIKTREIYETPAALVLIEAHRALESLTQPREMAHFKPIIEQKMSELIYEGLWFSPLMQALNAFVEKTQEVVTGTVRVKLYKGHAIVVGRTSEYSLYNKDLATYSAADAFDHDAAVGFIHLWGLPTKVFSQVNGRTVSIHPASVAKTEEQKAEETLVEN